MKITNVENCAGPDGIVTLSDDTTITVNDDCSLSLGGCVKVKGYNTASGQYQVSLNGRRLVGKSVDLCDPTTKNAVIGKIMPGGVCPVGERDICIDPNMKIPVGKMLSMLKGTIVIEAALNHDTGISCIKIEAVASK
ncbi:uncharacterized protein LOC101463045 [Anopheles sinensis]|uniref:Uncharacterized protein LOC101463045 n=1 Tax=Anopheles sinensis TaxID=74873 RepID=A0A084W3X3_ANOSI|nr:uncharacterized protein LOC101463045 [Anopheles sinensis]